MMGNTGRISPRRAMRTVMVAAWVGVLLGRALRVAGQTREFEIRDDRPLLGGREIDIWGLRCGSAMTRPKTSEVF